MGRVREAFAALADERSAEIVGKVLCIILVIVIAAIIAGIVAIGYFEAAAVVRASRLDPRLDFLLRIVFGVVAIAAVIAVMPPLVRSIFGESAAWWTNVFRLIALIVIVFLVAVVRPLDFHVAIRGITGSGNGNGNGEPVGLVPASSPALPEDIAAIRREAILERYWRILAGANDEALTKRYEQVKQWRPITERYATAAGLDRRKVEAIMAAESGGDPRATSTSNARGLMQTIDENAQAYGPACGWTSPADSYDPERSICMGASFLVDLTVRHFPGDWETAVAAYNWGATNLNNALDRMAARFPGSQRSFWALWDKADPESVATLPPARRARNPRGNLLFNSGRNPNETRYYVPTVLAWEHIIRYMDEHGRPPDRNGHREPPSVARQDHPPTAPPPAPAPPPQPPPQPPQSNVWYTTQRGEDIGHVLLLFPEPTELIVDLNPEIASARDVTVGAKVHLPDARYAFHRASGRESYRDIAERHGMTAAELFRWSGRWDDREAWRASRRDCPLEGCEDERVLASVGERFLVRRR